MNNALQSFINKNSTKAQQYHDIIEDMLESNRFRYAEDTLYGILKFIQENYSITEKQIEAVENIKNEPSSPNWDAPPF